MEYWDYNNIFETYIIQAVEYLVRQYHSILMLTNNSVGTFRIPYMRHNLNPYSVFIRCLKTWIQINHQDIASGFEIENVDPEKMFVGHQNKWFSGLPSQYLR